LRLSALWFSSLPPLFLGTSAYDRSILSLKRLWALNLNMAITGDFLAASMVPANSFIRIVFKESQLQANKHKNKNEIRRSRQRWSVQREERCRGTGGKDGPPIGIE
jgi:hypothetical protein